MGEVWAPWLADVLRGVGLKVEEHEGWKTRGHGGFTHLSHLIWHHDASAPGDSPGVCRYMLDNWNSHGAQLWVSRQGEWHILAAGVAFHAGAVRAGKPGNRYSLGVETDHTTGEDWPPALLRSLRVGTAAILRRMGADEGSLEFHKTICTPPGRKSDPDGLDLATERRRVAELLTNPTDRGDDDMTPEQDARLKRVEDFLDALTAPRRQDKADRDGARLDLGDLLNRIERLEQRK